jgi:spermidine synthase
MGVTLPVLCRFYVAHLDHLGSRTGRLYGVNTVGAAAGAVLCGFFLIHKLGIWGTLYVAAAVNGIVGISCMALSRVVQDMPERHEAAANGLGATESSVAASRDPAVGWALLIFAVSGFSAMAYEVIWTRLLGLIIGPTTYSFTLVIASFIVGLAVGSVYFGLLGDRVKGVFFLLVGTQLGAACLALLVSHFFGNSQFFFAKLIYTFQDEFNAMIALQFIIIFVILLGPTVMLGATFPLVNRIYARSIPVLGRSIGYAYALNTLGAILGSIAAGFVLIPWLGKENGLRFVMALQFTLALIAWYAYASRTGHLTSHRRMLAGMTVLGVILFLSFPSWDRQLLSYGRYRNLENMGDYLTATSWSEALYRGSTSLAEYETRPEVVFYGDGIGGFTTVEKEVNSLGTVKYSLLNSGKPDASSHEDRSTQTLLAHVPLLFHPHPERVMVLGLASGMTAGEALLYPVEKLDVLEINEEVVKACEIFAPWNYDCLNDPRMEVIVQDGRNHLALTRSTYDVIISEPSNPWMAGLANLYTLEFFKAVKQHLRRPGIFVQWVHSYEMDWPTFAMIGRTFSRVFEHGLLLTTVRADHLLVGFSGPKRFDPAVGEKNIKYAHRSENVFIANARLPFQMIVAEDLETFFGPGPLHTDTWPRLEFTAPRQLHRYDLPSQKRMHTGYQISQYTRRILEGENSIDRILDKIAFSASAYASHLEIPDLGDASTSQMEWLRTILGRYCTETLVQNYDMFSCPDMKGACAERQAHGIRRHLATTPDDASAYYDLSLALEQMNHTEDAVQALHRAISLNPFYVNAYNRLGLIMARQGRLEEAAGYFSKVLQIKPGDARAQQYLEAISR